MSEGLKCIACKNDEFSKQDVNFHVNTELGRVDVVTEAFVCTKCGKAVMDDTLMDEFRKKVADY